MLRRHASLIIAICLILLVATACLVRSGRGAPRGNSYRSAPAEKHKKHKHEKHKHKKHKKHR